MRDDRTEKVPEYAVLLKHSDDTNDGTIHFCGSDISHAYDFMSDRNTAIAHVVKVIHTRIIEQVERRVNIYYESD